MSIKVIKPDLSKNIGNLMYLIISIILNLFITQRSLPLHLFSL